MKDETGDWIRYANENLAVAKLARRDGHLNACIQNVQQSVEKALKAVVTEFGLPFRKTHSIAELHQLLVAAGRDCALTEEECEILDAVYLPSKYPLGGVLPPVQIDSALCDACIAAAERALDTVRRHMPPREDLEPPR